MAEVPPSLQSLLVRLLSAANIDVDNFGAISGLCIPRENLVRPDGYTAVATMIPELKAHFSSTHLTALQEEAPGTQRWPLLNLVRQVLRASGYLMCPRRTSNGYGPGGRKRYRRVFDIVLANDPEIGVESKPIQDTAPHQVTNCGCLESTCPVPT
jgi:hypothetical protein